MTTGEMIKELLEKKNKSQVDLANYLGVQPNTVNRWIPTEKKKGIEPSRKFLPMIADFFHVSIDVLMGNGGEWDSKYHHMYSAKAMKKSELFWNWLESLGYTLEDNATQTDAEGELVIDTPTEVSISWTDDNGNDEERVMKYVEFDFLMKRIEKHIKIEFEDYYEKW